MQHSANAKVHELPGDAVEWRILATPPKKGGCDRLILAEAIKPCTTKKKAGIQKNPGLAQRIGSGEKTLFPIRLRKRSMSVSRDCSSFTGCEKPFPFSCLRRITPPVDNSQRCVFVLPLDDQARRQIVAELCSRAASIIGFMMLSLYNQRAPPPAGECSPVWVTAYAAIGVSLPSPWMG